MHNGISRRRGVQRDASNQLRPTATSLYARSLKFELHEELASLKTTKKSSTKASKRNNSTQKVQNEEGQSDTGSPTTGTRKKDKKTKSNEGPIHWVNASDHFSLVINASIGLAVFRSLSELQTADDTTTVDGVDCAMSLTLTVRGNPLPLRRHRTSRGFVYNPSSKAQASFRNETSMLVFGVPCAGLQPAPTSTPQAPRLSPPLFSADKTLAVTLILSLRRPLSHFRSSKRETRTLKASAPNALTCTTRTDADNLAKFVLDACNGLLYEDDRQIQSLHVIKKLDDEDQCLGSTQLLIRAIDGSMQDMIIQHALEPYHYPRGYDIDDN